VKLANELNRLCHEERWNKDWVVIESLYEAECAVIIVALSDNAKVGLSVKAGFPLAGMAPLANAHAQGVLGVTSMSGDSTVIMSEQALTPLFGLLRVNDNFFNRMLRRVSKIFTPVSKDEEVMEFLQAGTPQAEELREGA
jgi:hypothetical protein